MDFLSILEKFVENIAGKDAVRLLHLMKEYENISEFKLAEDLKININQIRNLLYKLNSFNLVYSTRKKDRDKGLYIYYWTFNFKHARDILIIRKKQELEHLQDELKKENEERFYICKNNCTRVELEEAMELEFKCQECGTLLHQEDSTKKIGEINHKISILNQELEELKKSVTIVLKAEEVKKKAKKKKQKKKIKKTKKKKQKKKIKKTKKKKQKKKIKKAKKSKKVKKKSKKSSKLLKKLRKKLRF
jgi:transcription initiation factor TFIIE subunit alpha